MLKDCPFCHHEKAEIYVKDHALRSGETREVYECGDCGLLYPRPRMDDVESLDYQSSLYRKKELKDPVEAMKSRDIRTWEVGKGTLRNISRLVRKRVKARGEALDIGTFDGQFCYMLGSIGFDAYGLELCDDAAIYAREKGLNVFTGLFPDTIPYKLEKKKFSFISMMECAYYLVDLRKALKKVHGMLKDGGYFLLKCHQGKSNYYKESNKSLFERYGDGIQGMPSLKSLTHCLKESGFEIVETQGAMTRASAPVDLSNIIDKKTGLRGLFIFTEAILNKMYEAFLLNTEDAERLIILARKGRVENG